jgi:hypothetical protein
MRFATALRSLVLTAAVSAVPAASFAGVFVSISFGAPPLLPVYEQPFCPAAGYIWTPGYWAFDDDNGYYWVPGAWVLAPYPGALWTPAYWGWGDGGYYFHPGYWGLHVGFYGGVNYGYGYYGHGFEGGYWDRDRFFYNREVMRVDEGRIHNVYNRHVEHIDRTNRISFNGGRGGIQERPNQQEMAFTHEQHVAPLAAQHQNEMRAAQNRMQFANVNHGRPQDVVRTQPVAFDHTMPVNNNHVTAPPANMQRPNAPSNAQPINTQPINRPAAPTQTFNRAPQGGYPQQQNQARPTFNQGYGQPRTQIPQQPMNQPRPTYNPGYNQPRMQPQPQPMHQAPQPTYSQPRMQAPTQQQMRPMPQPQMRQAPQPSYSQPRMQAPPQQQMRSMPQPQMRQAPQPQSRPEPPRGGNNGGHGR